METQAEITNPKGIKIKDSYYYYASREYPKLLMGAVYLLSYSRGTGRRLVEYRREILVRTPGYQPGPETILYRELQKRIWFFGWIWITIKKQGIMLDGNHVNREICFGEKFHFKSNPWNKYGLATFETGI